MKVANLLPLWVALLGAVEAVPTPADKRSELYTSPDYLDNTAWWGKKAKRAEPDNLDNTAWWGKKAKRAELYSNPDELDNTAWWGKKKE